MAYQVPEWNLVRTTFQKYIEANIGDIGGGLRYSSADAWMEDRERAYRNYSEKFKPENLSDVEQVKENYSNWLLASNNKSWTNLQRRGYEALDEPDKLCDLLKILQDESKSIRERVQAGLVGNYKVTGIGKAILTGFLHTIFPYKYGVWNKSTIDTTKKFDVYTPGLFSRRKGQTYQRINNLLKEMANKTDSDLNYIDGFMYYVAAKLPSKLN